MVEGGGWRGAKWESISGRGGCLEHGNEKWKVLSGLECFSDRMAVLDYLRCARRSSINVRKKDNWSQEDHEKREKKGKRKEGPNQGLGQRIWRTKSQEQTRRNKKRETREKRYGYTKIS